MQIMPSMSDRSVVCQPRTELHARQMQRHLRSINGMTGNPEILWGSAATGSLLLHRKVSCKPRFRESWEAQDIKSGHIENADSIEDPFRLALENSSGTVGPVTLFPSINGSTTCAASHGALCKSLLLGPWQS